MASRVLTLGTFDLFHPGHVNLLRECARFGRVTVALNTDGFVEQYKGRPPIMTLAERFRVVTACRWVDDVVTNTGGADSKPVIVRVKPRYIVHGDDWTGDSYMKQLDVTKEWLDERGIIPVYVPYTEGVSTHELIRRCRAFGS